MNNLLEIRDRIISVYTQYENFFVPAFRFLVSFLSLLYISSRIGYQEVLTGALPSLLIALICTLVPASAAAVILGLVMIIQLFSLALEAGLVALILFLVLCLLYFRFSPKDAMLIVMSPVCHAIGIPYVLPIAGGLVYGPVSAVASAIGVIMVSFMNFVHDNETTIGTTGGDEDAVTKFRFVVDGIAQNRTMIVTAAAVALVAVVVYAVRRLQIRYAWYIAVLAGAVVELIVLLVGDMLYAISISIGAAFLGVALSALIGCGITFFLFNLDYTRIENVQFEDDDYYYYVKAVPKNVYIAPRRTVKKINTSRHIRGGADAEDGAFGTFAEPGAEDATTGTWDRNE
ncbi:MAG: hypothetical protein PUE63_11815 [Lachnospiraceae bacterium]|nr:hypothetical protein [Lachnospiraceae bacterium]